MSGLLLLLLKRADAVVQAAHNFQGSAEPLPPDGLHKQAELERAIGNYRRVRRTLTTPARGADEPHLSMPPVALGVRQSNVG
jgi:hypothetical protein